MFLIANHFVIVKAFSLYIIKMPLYFKSSFIILLSKVILTAVILTLLLYLIEVGVERLVGTPNLRDSKGITYLIGILVTLGLYFLMTIVNFNYHYLTIVYTNHDKLFLNLLNILLLFLVYLCVVAIFNRMIIALGIFSLAGIIFVIANKLKISARNEPILPIEFSNILNIPDLLKIIQPSQVVAIIAVIILVIVIIGYGQYYLKCKAVFRWYERGLFIVITGLVFGTFMYFTPDYTPRFSDYQDTAFNRFLKSIQYRPVQTTPSVHMQYNGQVIGLVSMARVKVMDTPKGYSQAKVNEMAPMSRIRT